jgi:hypothetical protein
MRMLSLGRNKPLKASQSANWFCVRYGGCGVYCVYGREGRNVRKDEASLLLFFVVAVKVLYDQVLVLGIVQAEHFRQQPRRRSFYF